MTLPEIYDYCELAFENTIIVFFATSICNDMMKLKRPTTNS